MAFGIDFGTTNSAVTYESDIIFHTGASKPYPSIVAINNLTEEVKCGPEVEQNREALIEEGFEVIRSIKKHLGTDDTWNIAGRLWTPIDVAAALFRALKQHVEENRSKHAIKENLEKAVVAIPVGFSSRKRRDIRDAARMADIEITDFISESTAAYLQSKRAMASCKYVAVFDWGGGTLDVSILKTNGEYVEELAIKSLEEAGDDIDYTISQWAHRQIVTDSECAFSDMDRNSRDKLRTWCERAKIDLSKNDKASIVFRDYGDHKQVNLTLDLAILNQLVAPFIDKAIGVLKTTIRQANLSLENIDRILLVGGSSRLRFLTQQMNHLFPGRVYSPPLETWTVSQGASYLARKPGSYKLMQKVFLVLSDESLLEIASEGDEFGKGQRTFCLGLVEKSRSANLVFSESLDGVSVNSADTRSIGYLHVPSFDFYYEKIGLESQLTKDLTLLLRARSEKGNGNDQTQWEYEHLRFIYDMRQE